MSVGKSSELVQELQLMTSYLDSTNVCKEVFKKSNKGEKMFSGPSGKCQMAETPTGILQGHTANGIDYPHSLQLGQSPHTSGINPEWTYIQHIDKLSILIHILHPVL